MTASVLRSGILLLTIVLLLPLFNAAHAACQVLQSNGSALAEQDDPLFHLLTKVTNCPSDVFAFRDAIVEQGGTLQASMVANQGFNNPGHGNFSVFESVKGILASSERAIESGQFFLGHFTSGNAGVLTASKAMEGLMIE